MNFTSIISKMKSCPLLISVIAASIILCIVFLLQKNENSSATIETTSSADTDVSSIQTDITAVTDASAVMTSFSDSDEAASTTTETIDFVQFQTVEDDYFYDALFIGNSRTVGLSMFGSMPEETTFYATVGMNIYDLMTSTAQVPPEEGSEIAFTTLLSQQQFQKIYIMLGINDLGTGTSESFAEYYKSVVDQIHEMQPDAIIYIQSIINITAERDAQGDIITNDNINEKNALIQQLANNDYIYYLDINEVLVDENGFLNSDYTSDGIHLGGGSLSLWEDYLYSHAIVKNT
ncbi:MAG: GDSL-type esterase/lipase family protein [Ruminococcus sp.]